MSIITQLHGHYLSLNKANFVITNLLQQAIEKQEQRAELVQKFLEVIDEGINLVSKLSAVEKIVSNFENDLNKPSTGKNRNNASEKGE